MWCAAKEVGFDRMYFDSFPMYIYIGHKVALLNAVRQVESE